MDSRTEVEGSLAGSDTSYLTALATTSYKDPYSIPSDSPHWYWIRHLIQLMLELRNLCLITPHSILELNIACFNNSTFYT